MFILYADHVNQANYEAIKSGNTKCELIDAKIRKVNFPQSNPNEEAIKKGETPKVLGINLLLNLENKIPENKKVDSCFKAHKSKFSNGDFNEFLHLEKDMTIQAYVKELRVYAIAIKKGA